MSILAVTVDLVIGIDPHRHTHTASTVDADAGDHHGSPARLLADTLDEHGGDTLGGDVIGARWGAGRGRIHRVGVVIRW
ncbi:MAG TPA: hypothetical protein VIR58_03550 [Acidimicrobiales bacterium]